MYKINRKTILEENIDLGLNKQVRGNNIKQTEGIDPVSIIFHKSDVNNSYSLTRDPLHSSLPALSDTNIIYNIVMINTVEMSSHGE